MFAAALGGGSATPVSEFYSHPSVEGPRLKRVLDGLRHHGGEHACMMVMAKSHNDNVVMYTWRDGRIVSQWLCLENEAKARSRLPTATLVMPLNELEDAAFGATLTGYDVTLNAAALPELQFRVASTALGVKVMGQMDGVECRIDIGYAQLAKERTLIPRVEYVRFYGTDAAGESHVMKVPIPPNVGLKDVATRAIRSLLRGSGGSG